MATYTTRLNLKKPDPSDFYNIEDFNGNADKIDAKMLRIDDDLASQSDAETGTDNTKWMSPLRVRQGVNKLKASQSEAQAGTDDTKWMSPLRVKESITKYAFRIGDTIETFRTDLGDNWALCNGEAFNPSEYPELAKVAPALESYYMSSPSIKDFGVSPQSYIEANGYQVIVYNNSGLCVRWSTDNFKTYTQVQISSNTRSGYPSIFYVNGYFIIASTITYSGTPGSLEVYYGTTPNSWSQGATNSDDFYGYGLSRFFDAWYYDGKYYLAATGNDDTSNGNYYPYIFESVSPGFKKSAPTTITQVSSQRGNILAFVRTSTDMAFVSHSGSVYSIMYTTVSVPKAFTYKTFNVNGATLTNEYMNYGGISYIDGKFIFTGEYVSGSFRYPVLVYTSSLSADAWTALVLDCSYTSQNSAPYTSVMKIRDKYYMIGMYPIGQNTYSSIFVSSQILTASAWSIINTHDENIPVNTQIYNITPFVDDEYLYIFAGKYRIMVPLYAVPNGSGTSLYRYIRVKE